MPYVGQKPADIISTAIDTTTAKFSGEVDAASLDISGNIDVDGTTNLDVVDIDGAVDMASTLAVTGVVTANAGVVVDEITLDGDTLTATDDFIIDAVGEIVLDADNQGSANGVQLKDGGVHYGSLFRSDSDLRIKSIASDEDIVFMGNDGGAEITALTLDMSLAGKADFNAGATFAANVILGTGANLFLNDDGKLNLGNSSDLQIYFDATNSHIDTAGNLTLDAAGNINLDADGGNINLQDGGTDFGRIENQGGDLAIYSSASGHEGLLLGNGAIVPTDNAGSATDNACNLGGASGRFSNLYLAGGAFLGGTGSANELDDYEEGTWTPTLSQYAGSPTISSGVYTKVGRLVTASVSITLDGTSDASNFGVLGLPFTAISLATSSQGGFLSYGTPSMSTPIRVLTSQNSTQAFLYTNAGATVTYNSYGNDKTARIVFIYYT